MDSFPLKRRSLLYAAGVAVASPWVLPARVFGDAAPSRRIQTALIGSGQRGQQIMAGGDRVIAVCDVDAKYAEAAKNKIDQAAGNEDCKIYRDYREVLARPEIDAVVVATPDHWHAPIAIAAIRAGKAVFVEKPMTLTIREGRLMSDTVKRYGGILMVGSQQRSEATYLKACELIRNGRLGELKSIRVEIPTRAGARTPEAKLDSWTPQQPPAELNYDMWLGPAPYTPYHPARVHYNFRFVSDYSGGDVTNWGAHNLDIAQWALGMDNSGPVEVEGRGKRPESGMYDVFYGIEVDYTYKNGARMELRSGGNFVRFVGSEGTIQISRQKFTTEPESLATAKIGANEIHLDTHWAKQGLTHMGLWLECIRQGKPGGVNTPVEAGHRSATVCHLANISMELGRKLRWDPVAEKFDDDDANRLMWRPWREPWGV